MKFASSVLVSICVGSMVLVGCASASDSTDGVDVADTDVSDDSAEALRAADIEGAWSTTPNGPPPGAVGLPRRVGGPPPGALGLPILPEDNGPPAGAVGLPILPDDNGPPAGAVGLPIRIRPTLKAIVFTSQQGTRGKRFFADVETNMAVACASVSDNCTPKPHRVEGTYKVKGNKITLMTPPPADDFFSDALAGDYKAALVGGKLKLTADGITQTLNSKVSYCSTVQDCGRQSIIVPACIGSFSCAAERCGFRCGISITN